MSRSLKRRYFGISDLSFQGAVFSEKQPHHRFTIELIDAEGKAYLSTVADGKSLKPDIPDGYGFSMPVPVEWLTSKAHVREFRFRIKETGDVFPKELRELPVKKLMRQIDRLSESTSAGRRSLQQLVQKLPEGLSPNFVVVATHEMTRTGAPLIILEVIRQLKARHQLDVVLLSLDSGGELSDEFREECVEVVEGMFNAIRNFGDETRRMLSELASHSESKTAIANSLCSTEIGAVCRTAGFEVTSLVHEYPYAFDLDWIEKLFAASEGVVFPCRDVYERYCDVRLVGNKAANEKVRAFILPQGCYQLERPEPDIVSVEEFVRQFRAENFLKPADRVVLSCGTADSRKGFDWFANLIRYYGTHSKNAFTTHFVWVGGIGQEDLYLHAVHDMKREGVIGHFHHIPEVEDVRPVMREADLFLLCSRIDPFPSVVMEAFVAGLPVIGFDRDQGTSEMIQETGFGAVVPYQDLEAATKAIDEIFDKDNERTGLGDSGKEFVQENFPYSKYTDSLLNWVIHKKPLPEPGREAIGSDPEESVSPIEENAVEASCPASAVGENLSSTSGPNATVMDSLKFSLRRSLDFLASAQREDGEFSTMIWFGDDVSSAKFDSSPFVTALISYSLQQCFPRSRPLLDRALEFLSEQMEPEGVWRYYSKNQFKHQRVPPDLDDTSCASLVLKQNQVPIPENQWIFEANRGEDGLFYTWLLPEHCDSPSWKGYLSTLEQLAEMRSPAKPKEYVGITRFNTAREAVPVAEVDSAVVANVLSYLGETEVTRDAVEYLIELIEAGNEDGSSFYYVDVISIYYMIARAFECGVKRFEEISDIIGSRVEERLEAEHEDLSALNLSISLCVLLILGRHSERTLSGVRQLLTMQKSDGSWEKDAFYSGPPVSPSWGSEELTTGFAMEAIARFLKANVAETEAVPQGLKFLDDDRALDFDLRRLDFRINPNPVFSFLRENCPVVYNKASDSWLITRYQDVITVFNDSETYSSQCNSFESILMGGDGPDHEKVHRMVKMVFSKKNVVRLERELETWVDSYVEMFASAGICEFCAEVARPLPWRVIAFFMGIQESMIPRLMEWGDMFIRFSLNRKNEGIPQEDFDELQKCRDYFQQLVEGERNSPSGSPFSGLVNGGEEGTSVLDEVDLVDISMVLMSAGSATTVNLLAIAMHRVASDPELAKSLRASPELIPKFIEEVLRFEPPFQDVIRITRQPALLGGQRIPAGQYIQLMVGAANRDPDYFPEPDEFKPDRKSNRHLSFGSGPHVCVGMMVSRLEAKLVLEKFLARFEQIEFDGDSQSFPILTEFTLRRPKSLPLRFSVGGEAPEC